MKGLQRGSVELPPVVLKTVDRIINLTPASDMFDHTATATCRCKPRVEHVYGADGWANGMLVIHRNQQDRDANLIPSQRQAQQ